MRLEGPTIRQAVAQDANSLLHEALSEIVRAAGLKHFFFGRIPETGHPRLLRDTITSSCPVQIYGAIRTTDRRNGLSLLAVLSETVTPVVLQNSGDAASVEGDLAAGIGMLLHDRDGQQYFLVLTSTHIDLPKERQAVILLDALTALEQFSLRSPLSHQLSSRELGCLKWTAAGKSSPEIAVIYGLSVHTITGHLKSALKKLDCVTRAHAVAKATRLKLI